METEKSVETEKVHTDGDPSEAQKKCLADHAGEAGQCIEGTWYPAE